MTEHDYGKTLLALVAYREARGEEEEGIRAVVHVILNRVAAWNQDVIKVVTGKNQFSSMTSSGDSQLVVWPQAGDLKFIACMKLVDAAMGEESDPTMGALYYANLTTATSGWFFDNIVLKPEEHPKTVAIGHHTFFK